MNQPRRIEPGDQPRLELFELFHDMQLQFTEYMQQSNMRLQQLEEKALNHGEDIGAFKAELNQFRSEISRIEGGILQEFKTSQQLMKALIEHDMSIEKAKLEFQQQLEKQQKEQELQNKQARQEMKRNLYIKLGGVGVPLISALTAVVIRWLDTL